MTSNLTKSEFLHVVMELINEGIYNYQDYEKDDLGDWAYFLSELKSKGVSSALRKVGDNLSSKGKTTASSLNSKILNDREERITIMV